LSASALSKNMLCFPPCSILCSALNQK
jgi:hypothetical protein